MFRKFALILAAVVMGLPAAKAADIVYQGGGVFTQIVGGGPWTMVISLANLDGVVGAYELHFIGNDGNPLTIATTAGTGSVLSGTLAAYGSTIIQTTEPPDGPIKEGWAYVVTNNTIGGSVVYRLSLPNSPIYEASLPLDTDYRYQFGMPFDQVNSNTGVALANSYGASPLTVTITFLNQAGTQLFQDTISMPIGTHMSFMLSDRYPQTAGQQGLFVITGSYYMNVLGLRATDGGFTSVTPLIRSDW